MSVTEALLLLERREELQASVDLLTLDGKHALEDGRRASTMPLLAAVADARLSSDGQGFRSTTLASTRSVVRLTPTELLIDVDRATGVRAGRGRLRAVRAWSARTGSTGSLGDVAEAAQLAARWVETARAVLEPRRWLALRGATCPDCGHAQVVTRGNAGEDIVEPALAADTRRGIVACAVDGCAAAWPFDQLELLADQLARQSVEVLGQA